MASWTEEATARPLLGDPVALRPAAARDVLTVTGVPWVTLMLLVACGWVLAAAGGLPTSLSGAGLPAFGANGAPRNLDRGGTSRLLSSNPFHQDIPHPRLHS